MDKDQSRASRELHDAVLAYERYLELSRLAQLPTTDEYEHQPPAFYVRAPLTFSIRTD